MQCNALTMTMSWLSKLECGVGARTKGKTGGRDDVKTLPSAHENGENKTERECDRGGQKRGQRTCL